MTEIILGVVLLLLLGGGEDEAEQQEEEKEPGEPGGPIVPADPPVDNGNGETDPVVGPPKPDPTGPNPVRPPFTPFPPIDPSVVPPGEEPVFPPLPTIVDPYPTPGMFYVVQSGNTPYQVAYRALLTAGYLAAKQYGGDLSDSEVTAFAKQVASKVRNQVWYLDQIQCNGWNDFFYATYGYGSSSHASQHGRALRFLPWHADQLERIADGLSPLRTQRWGTPSDKRKGNRVGVLSSERNYATLWLPGIKLQVLWNSAGATLELGGFWSNDDSKIWPPQWILDLGKSVAAGAEPQGTDFGCGAGEMKI